MSWIKGSSAIGRTPEQAKSLQDAGFWYWQLQSNAYWNLNLECYGEY